MSTLTREKAACPDVHYMHDHVTAYLHQLSLPSKHAHHCEVECCQGGEQQAVLRQGAYTRKISTIRTSKSLITPWRLTLPHSDISRHIAPLLTSTPPTTPHPSTHPLEPPPCLRTFPSQCSHQRCGGRVLSQQRDRHQACGRRRRRGRRLGGRGDGGDSHAPLQIIWVVGLHVSPAI